MNNDNLQIRDLSFSIEKFDLSGINLQAGKGEYHILMGPTGSGKSTLIKCVLGLYEPSGGAIFLNGRKITSLPPEARRLGYLPQNYGLFPHLDVEGNIRFGLKARKTDPAGAEETVKRLVDILKIEKLRGRSVRNLSGGEKQKVALARALAARPEVILLDEPFSSIDEESRRTLWFELKEVIGEVGITALHITHNLEEAYTLGERLSVLIEGRLVQSGPREEIFERPASEEVAQYLNYRNIFRGTAESRGSGTRIDLGHFAISLQEKYPEGNELTVCLRPQDLKVIREDAPIRGSLAANVFSGEIVSLFMLPQYSVMHFKIDRSPRPYDLELKFPAYIKDRHGLSVGKPIRVAAWEPSIIVF